MASGMLGGRQADGPIGAIIGMLAQHPGGLSGLVSQLQQSGLGDIVNSWVSTGQNQPVSPGQLSGMFNSDQLGQLAQTLGTDQEGALGHLSQLLPQVVDKLSPQGTLPADSDWMSQAGGLLGGLLKG